MAAAWHFRLFYLNILRFVVSWLLYFIVERLDGTHGA
jgi:hypothetical protein